MDDTALLALAADLALQAGAAILAVRDAGFAVERKEDRSPVTAADHAAEALIVAGLRAAAPEIPVIAEEEVAGGRITAPSAQYWLVDPLDGTREFAAGRNEFAVNIGLVRNGRAHLGVVGVPAFGELFGAIAGQGAWKRDAAGQRPIAARLPPAEGVVVLASRSHGDVPRLTAFLEGRQVARVEKYGSALKICRLAEGRRIFIPASDGRWSGTPARRRRCSKRPADRCGRWTGRGWGTGRPGGRIRISSASGARGSRGQPG